MWDGFWSSFWSNAAKLGFTHRRALVVVLAAFCAWLLVEGVSAWTAFAFVLLFYLLEPAGKLISSLTQNRRAGPRVDGQRREYAQYLHHEQAKLLENQHELPFNERVDDEEIHIAKQDLTDERD